MFGKILSGTTKTGHVAAADHHKLVDTDESWTQCPCDNLAHTVTPLFSHQDGDVLPF